MNLYLVILIAIVFLSIPTSGVVLLVTGRKRSILTEIVGILNIIIGIPLAITSIGFLIIGDTESITVSIFSIILLFGMACIGFVLLSRKRTKQIAFIDSEE